MSTPDSDDDQIGPGPNDGEPEPRSELEGAQEEVVEGELADDDRPDRRVQVTAESFRGPLPAPKTLAEYDEIIPGLAREIVDQWKGETAHRHDTVEYLRETDRMAMQAYYQGEMRGQYLSLVAFVGVIAIAIVAIVLHSTAIGIAAIVSGGASAIWAMRRRANLPGDEGEPKQLDDGDALQRTPDQAPDQQPPSG